MSHVQKSVGWKEATSHSQVSKSQPPISGAIRTVFLIVVLILFASHCFEELEQGNRVMSLIMCRGTRNCPSRLARWTSMMAADMDVDADVEDEVDIEGGITAVMKGKVKAIGAWRILVRVFGECLQVFRYI